MIYTTNWIERLNRNYKRTLNMRGAMPSSDSVLFLLGSVALQTTETTYARPIAIFRDWVTLRPPMHPATSKEDSSQDA